MSHASAQTPLKLELESPPDCASRDEIISRVMQLLGQAQYAETLRAKVTVSPQQHTVQLKLEMWVNQQRFERRVDVASCEEATKTAALILALAVRPDLALAADPASTESSAARATNSPVHEPLEPHADEPHANEPRASKPTASTDEGELVDTSREGLDPVLPSADAEESKNGPTQPANLERTATEDPEAAEAAALPKAAKSPSTSPVLGTLALGYAASAWLLPEVGHAVMLGAGVGFGPVQAEAYGLFSPPVRIALDQNHTRGGEFTLWHAGLRACYVFNLERLIGSTPASVGVCGLGEGGEVSASGFGSGTVESTRRVWGAFGGGANWGVKLGGSATLRLSASALAPLVQDRFSWDFSDGTSASIASLGAVFARFEAALLVPL